MADLRQSMFPEHAVLTEDGAYGYGDGSPQHSNLLTFPPARGRRVPSAIAVITDAVQFDVVPRLVLAHPIEPRPEERQAVAVGRGERSTDAVRQFCKIVLSKQPEALNAHMSQLRAEGRSLEAIYLGLILPSARYLRQLWDEDLCDFAEASLALWRLQQLLRDNSAAFRSTGAQHSCGLRALLAPAPGETHELGYLMVEIALIGEFFRRDGWDAWIEPKSSGVEFSSLVRSQWFDVVEFLVSGDKRMDALAASISAVRRDSPNQGLRVLVCGPAFVEHPELVLVVGGDVPAEDPRQGVAQARNLVGPPASRG
jgi:MerR family transcriptional regulator, light-induced transcriptional regulator